MPEPTMQVPVSLIEGLLGDFGNRRARAVREVRALLSQPTPRAEPDDRDKVLDWFLALNTCPDDASRLARLAQALGYAKSFGFVWPHRAEFDPSTIRDVTPPEVNP